MHGSSRESGRETGLDINLEALINPELDIGVPGGAELLAFPMLSWGKTGISSIKHVRHFMTLWGQKLWSQQLPLRPPSPKTIGRRTPAAFRQSCGCCVTAKKSGGRSA